jgi:hypothetical protein
MAKKHATRRVKLGIPTPENRGLHMCHIGEKSKDRLIRAFCEIINLLCEREQGFIRDHHKELFPVSYVLKDVGVFEPDVPPKLRELWEAIDDAVTDAMVRGEQTGASLLKQLASGKATIDDYNEAALKRD